MPVLIVIGRLIGWRLSADVGLDIFPVVVSSTHHFRSQGEVPRNVGESKEKSFQYGDPTKSQ